MLLTTKISTRIKLTILLSYVIIVLVVIVSIFAGETLYPQVFEMDPSRFLLGFAATAFQFRSDLFILVMLLPISIGLFVLARNRFQEADSVLFLIFGNIFFIFLLSIQIKDFPIGGVLFKN